MKVDVGTLGTPAPGSAAETAAPRRSPTAERRPDAGGDGGDVRENIRLRRAFVMVATGADEAIGHYVHGAVAPGMGQAAREGYGAMIQTGAAAT